MDRPIPSEEVSAGQGSGNGRSHPDPEVLARFQSLADRLVSAIGEHTTVDGLAQQFSAVLGDAFGGMCNITLLNQHNEMMHIAGLYDPDPRAMVMAQDMVAATVDLPRDQGVAAAVMRGGEPLLVESIRPEDEQGVTNPAMARYLREVGVQSLMATPLKGRSGTIGALTITRHRGDPGFTRGDLDELATIAVRISNPLDLMLRAESLRAQLVAVAAQRETAAHAAQGTALAA